MKPNPEDKVRLDSEMIAFHKMLGDTKWKDRILASFISFLAASAWFLIFGSERFVYKRWGYSFHGWHTFIFLGSLILFTKPIYNALRAKRAKMFWY